MKEFRIAEIVPVSCLEATKENQYHMCLANLVAKSSDYTKFYKRMSDEGRFVLMDNGAAEGEQLDFEELIECYKKIQPTEIVLPDTLCDMRNTVEKSVLAYNYFDNADILEGKRIMVVPQGNTLDEWKECAVALLNMIPVNTIGISKFLQMKTGDEQIRLTALEWLSNYKQAAGVEVHLLGCSEGPSIVRQCAERYGNLVRGCDSAFAYIATKVGAPISEMMKRPEGEIDFLSDKWINTLPINLVKFEGCVGVKDNDMSSSWDSKEE